MEERVEAMTNEQWFGVLRLVSKIIKRCPTKEEALKEIEDLLKGDKNYDAKKGEQES